MEKRKISMGKSTFLCRNCQALTVVESGDLETMAEFKCGGCGFPMSAPAFARVKIAYLVKYLAFVKNGPFMEGPEMFKCVVDFNPHYETVESEENGSPEGV